MNNRLFILTLLVLLSFKITAQEKFTINLTRKVYPSFAYDRGMASFYRAEIPLKTKNGHDSVFRPIDNYDFIAGDFSDGKTKFSVAYNIKQKTLYVFPYKKDSVDIDAAVNYTNVWGDSLLTLRAYGKTYGAAYNNAENAVTLIPLEGVYKHPDARIYDSLMPDGTFTLINGQKDKFSNYTHHHKYIFIMFWNTMQMGDTKDLDELKNISDLYKEALTVISFHRDTMLVKQLENEKQLDWTEARDNRDIEGCFPAGHGNDGILFDENGKALAFCLRPNYLKPFIEKLLHVTN